MKSRKSTLNIFHKFCLSVAILVISQASIAQNTSSDEPRYSDSENRRLALPDIGGSFDNSFSNREAREYAEYIIRQLRGYNLLVEDPLIEAYFADMGQRLASNSNRPETVFHFVIIKNSVLNAWAAPGGVVALHTGLIMTADEESEVAGVLGHEIAHITQSHAARGMENSRKVSLPIMLAALGLAILSGSAEVAQGVLVTGQALSQQNQINFTRQNEHEADRLGIQTMAASGYDPFGMAAFFSKMARSTRSNGEGPPEYMSTHPLSTTRIAEAKNRASNITVIEPRDDLNFYLVKARIRALEYADNPEEAIRYFNSLLDRSELNPHQLIAAKYGLVMSMKQKGELSQARRILAELLAADPDRGAFVIEETLIDSEQGNFAKAQAHLLTLYNRFPGNIVISTYLLRALLADGTQVSAEKAIPIIREQLLVRENDPTIYDLYAQAANRAERPIKTAEAVAEAHFLRGNVHQAVMKLRQVSKQKNLDYYQRARISARLAELEIELAENGERLKKNRKS